MAMVILATACQPATTAPSPGPADDVDGPVTWIYDGDTLVVGTPEGEVDVRLVGLNAPEKEECLGDIATDHLVDTLKGRAVRIEGHGSDQFGRRLAVIWDGDRNVNLELVMLGLAIATFPEPGQPDFISVETVAATEAVGLWAPDACGGGPIDDVVIDVGSSTVDPAGPDDEFLAEEAITIRNTSDKKVNLAGWTLRDESSRHRFTFPGGSQLEVGEKLTITSADQGWDPGASPVWSNDGDIVMLLDRHGRVVDHWRYQR